MKKAIGFYAFKHAFLVNRRLSRLILTGIFMVFLTSNLMWAQQLPPEELPPPTVENCFYMMPLWESFRIPSHVSFEEKFIQIEKMKQQLGQGNIYHRLGFGAIYASGGAINVWRENARLAQQAKIHLGAIFALQSHSRQVFRDAVSHDFRYFQWRIDGQDWKGSFTSFYNNGAHILTPGWWSVGRTDDKFNIFPTDDSKFVDALGDFIKTTPNRPYWQKNANVNYTPPKVWGVNAFLSKDNELSIFWENLIWPGHRTSWREWEYFKGYELSTSTDGSNWDTEHTLYNLAFRDVNPENPFHIRVRAEKTDGVFGPWSEVYTFEPLSGSTKLTLISERNPASARADLVNLITIEPEQGGPFLEGNPYGTLSITQNHANVTTELHNPDMPGSGLVRMSINDASSFATGNAQIVTLTAPEGAFLEGIEFDYHSNYQKDKMTLVMLDDQDQIIWENNNSGVTSGNKTHGFASPVSSISFAINIKQPGTIASGSFVSISGIRSFYSPGSIFPVPNIDLSLSGDGIPCNTRPNNIESIEKFWSMDDAGQVYNVMNCTNVVFENGYFSATSATHDPYFTFTQSAIDGTQLKHIAFRLYSSKAGTAQLFHFSSDGPRRQDFPIQEGWHVYHLMGTDHWQAQTEITSVRLDPNIEAGVHFKLDWFAISSQPVSDLIVPDFTMTPDNKVQVAIAGSGVEGEYTLTATHHGNANPITVQTLLNPPTNIKPLQVDKKEEAIIAYPNPFHSEVNFSINLKSNELVKLEVYDFSGRKVASLKNEIMVQGEHILTWKPEYNFRAGIYIYMLEVGGMVYPGKILYKGRN